MTIFVTALTFIIILSILVVVHEWGHFIVARLFGIRVDEFSLGFGPRAIRIGQRGDTEYNVRWIPLGGYVKIAGMDPDEEPILRARDKIVGRDKEREVPLVAENTPDQAETEAQALQDTVDGFYSKPLWQRSLVIFAGPFMSFVLGYIALCFIGLTLGVPSDITNKVDSVLPKSEAQHMGLRAGDTIVQIGNTSIRNGEQMEDIIHSALGKQLTLTVQRGGVPIVLTGTPRPQPDSQTGKPMVIKGKVQGFFGFSPLIASKRVSVRESVRMGNEMTVAWLAGIKNLIIHHRFSQIRQNAGGPIFMAEMTKSAVKHGPIDVVLLLAQLSMSLAIFNLLPIPILDGGHLLEFAIEKIRSGRRMTPEQKQNFMLAGLAVIGILFVLIMFNDILRTIHHQLPQ
ncbi:MAG TPA: M50 family metallopeptidase [Capsulimonadaceae bacterium]|nr:M50 family metallopeptidase [Capsulimonadaceae bacterium]